MKIFFYGALIFAILALLAAIEPRFGQVGGAPIGLGIAAAGFAIAHALETMKDKKMM